MDELTFNEYHTWPVPRLVNHPGFSARAMRVVEAVTQMTSKELEQINLNPEFCELKELL